MSEERERYPEEGAEDRREEEGAPLAAAQTRGRDRRSRYRTRICSAACRSWCAARSVRRSSQGVPARAARHEPARLLDEQDPGSHVVQRGRAPAARRRRRRRGPAATERRCSPAHPSARMRKTSRLSFGSRSGRWTNAPLRAMSTSSSASSRGRRLTVRREPSSQAPRPRPPRRRRRGAGRRSRRPAARRRRRARPDTRRAGSAGRS